MRQISRPVSRLLVVCFGSLLLAACATPHDDELTESTVSSQVFLPGKPGIITTSVTTLEANVIAINSAKRQITLQDEQGNKRTLTIGQEATNFDQIKVGDHFVLQSASEMAVFMVDDKAKAINEDRAVGLKAAKGDKPAFLVVESEEIKAVISAVDTATRMATLTFEDGTTDAFTVRPDVEITQKMVGQAIIIRLTDAVALSVTAQ